MPTRKEIVQQEAFRIKCGVSGCAFFFLCSVVLFVFSAVFRRYFVPLLIVAVVSMLAAIVFCFFSYVGRKSSELRNYRIFREEDTEHKEIDPDENSESMTENPRRHSVDCVTGCFNLPAVNTDSEPQLIFENVYAIPYKPEHVFDVPETLTLINRRKAEKAANYCSISSSSEDATCTYSTTAEVHVEDKTASIPSDQVDNKFPFPLSQLSYNWDHASRVIMKDDSGELSQAAHSTVPNDPNDEVDKVDN
ncbi:hypothetical protein NPIL_240771 [Nephila pilipes]|uniref:Transmembrane protein n=1 Tax=Nephila pilipes TaxID=299642 RepID=A0A8X6QDS8_NEPPI|nr:hypothetical protein NPIL_240771 [Nephila pilipes]